MSISCIKLSVTSESTENETSMGEGQRVFPTPPEQRQQSEVPGCASWVQLRPARRDVPAEVRTAPAGATEGGQRQQGTPSAGVMTPVLQRDMETVPEVTGEQGGPPVDSAASEVTLPSDKPVAGLGQSGHQVATTSEECSTRQQSSPAGLQKGNGPEGPAAAESTQPLDLSASRPGRWQQDAIGVPTLRGGRLPRQRRPAVWSRDYDMSL